MFFDIAIYYLLKTGHINVSVEITSHCNNIT